MFKSAAKYENVSLERRNRALKQIEQEFRRKNAKHLFFLDETFMERLRDIFEKYPVCRCLLTRVTNEISLRSMFEGGVEEEIRSMAGKQNRYWSSTLTALFSTNLEGLLQTFVRELIRSVWIYGFVVVRYGQSSTNDDVEVSVPECVSEEDYIVFRDEFGSYHARDYDGWPLQITFMDFPDSKLRVRSALSHLRQNAEHLEKMRGFQIKSARNAAPSILITGKKPDKFEEENRLQLEYEKREQRVTQQAMNALISKRDSATTSADGTHRLHIPRAVDFETEYVSVSNDRERLVAELRESRKANAELRTNPRSENNGNGLANECEFENNVMINLEDENRRLEAHRLDVKLLNIDSAIEEFNHHVKNVFLGTVTFTDRGSSFDAGHTVPGNSRDGERFERVMDSCVIYWQRFIVNVVLQDWMRHTGIPLRPRLQRKKEDINCMVTLFRFIAPERRAKILGEILEIPVSDIIPEVE